HQAELHHPGVWVKNVLIDLLAQRLNGQAVHVAVDTDAPKHLVLRWPGGFIPLTDDPDAGRVQWSGLLGAPTPGHLDRVEREIQRAARSWDFQPIVQRFVSSMRRLSTQPGNLPAILTSAQHDLDASLGLRHRAMRVSPLWESPAYLLFAHHVAARADAF